MLVLWTPHVQTQPRLKSSRIPRPANVKAEAETGALRCKVSSMASEHPTGQSQKIVYWNLLKPIEVDHCGHLFPGTSLGLAHAAGGCSARMQTRTRSQLASAKYCNVTAQNDCGANLLQKLRCNSALLYILRKFWECTCICWQLLRSWLQKPLAFAYYKNEKNTSVPTWWVLRLLTTTSPWQVLKSPFIYCFQATGKALRPTAPRWKSLSEATPEPAHIVRCTGKIILLYIYIYIS